jgi:acetyl/propionyl-CoA carboxylase alpha subunit
VDDPPRPVPNPVPGSGHFKRALLGHFCQAPKKTMEKTINDLSATLSRRTVGQQALRCAKLGVLAALSQVNHLSGADKHTKVKSPASLNAALGGAIPTAPLCWIPWMISNAKDRAAAVSKLQTWLEKAEIVPVNANQTADFHARFDDHYAFRSATPLVIEGAGRQSERFYFG